MKARQSGFQTRLPRSALRLLSAAVLALVLLLCLRVYTGTAASETVRFRKFRGNASVSDPSVCAIVRTGVASFRSTSASIFSLASSSYPRLHVFLLRTTNEESMEFIELATTLNKMLEEPMVSVLAAGAPVAKSTFPNAPEADTEWILNDMALELLLAASVRDYCASGWHVLADGGSRLRSRHAVCDLELSLPLCDYFIFTKPTSLYVDVLLPALLPEMRNKRVAVAWNFISLRKWPTDAPGVCPGTGGTYSQMSAAFEANRIEESSALVQAEYFRRRPSLRFVVDRLRNSKQKETQDLATTKGTDYAGQLFNKIAQEPELHKTDLVILPKTMTLN